MVSLMLFPSVSISYFPSRHSCVFRDVFSLLTELIRRDIEEDRF
jgi:hypothetical protein